MDKILILLGKLFAMLVASLLLAIFLGFITSKMWLWFLVPVGLPELSVIQATGLLLIIDLATFRYAYMKTDSQESVTLATMTSLLSSVLHAFFILLFGFILTFFI